MDGTNICKRKSGPWRTGCQIPGPVPLSQDQGCESSQRCGQGPGLGDCVLCPHPPGENGVQWVQFLWTEVALGFPTLGALTSGRLMNLGAQPCTRMGRPRGGGVSCIDY